MKPEETQPELTSQEIFDNLVKQLLAKPESDEELEIELHGYPADFLDTPKASKMTLKEYNEIERNYGASVEFEVLSLNGDDVHIGIVYTTEAPLLLLDFGIRKAYITTKKLRSLLHDGVARSFVQIAGNRERFVIKLPTRLLLDNSEVM